MRKLGQGINHNDPHSFQGWNLRIASANGHFEIDDSHTSSEKPASEILKSNEEESKDGRRLPPKSTSTTAQKKEKASPTAKPDSNTTNPSANPSTAKNSLMPRSSAQASNTPTPSKTHTLASKSDKHKSSKQSSGATPSKTLKRKSPSPTGSARSTLSETHVDAQNDESLLNVELESGRKTLSSKDPNQMMKKRALKDIGKASENASNDLQPQKKKQKQISTSKEGKKTFNTFAEPPTSTAENPDKRSDDAEKAVKKDNTIKREEVDQPQPSAGKEKYDQIPVNAARRPVYSNKGVRKKPQQDTSAHEASEEGPTKEENQDAEQTSVERGEMIQNQAVNELIAEVTEHDEYEEPNNSTELQSTRTGKDKWIYDDQSQSSDASEEQ